MKDEKGQKSLSDSLTKTFYDAFCIGSMNEVRAKIALIDNAPEMLKKLIEARDYIVENNANANHEFIQQLDFLISKAQGKL